MCNNINTQKLDTAAACGARKPACVLRHHGKKFNCGQCVSSIQDRLNTLNAIENASLLQAAE
ncbi:hypothetical protein [Fretibacter rubidus]|uniref:hypothetical protein n=1 Tax=Fretibacter rubidus TaxID=570162 RepID=UPI00352A8CC8